jgi:hypothetical protein
MRRSHFVDGASVRACQLFAQRAGPVLFGRLDLSLLQFVKVGTQQSRDEFAHARLLQNSLDLDALDQFFIDIQVEPVFHGEFTLLHLYEKCQELFRLAAGLR